VGKARSAVPSKPWREDHDYFCRRQDESAEEIRQGRGEEKPQAGKEVSSVQEAVSDGAFPS
jgi:hypothetical protein